MTVAIKHLGLVSYQESLAKMQAISAAGAEELQEQIWLLQHPAVFTLGLAGRDEMVHRDDLVMTGKDTA